MIYGGGVKSVGNLPGTGTGPSGGEQQALSPMHASLFVAEGFDRVELCGFAAGEVSGRWRGFDVLRLPRG